MITQECCLSKPLALLEQTIICGVLDSPPHPLPLPHSMDC